MKYLDKIEMDYDYRRDSRDNFPCLDCVHYDGNISCVSCWIEKLMRIKTEKASYLRGNKGNKKKKNV